MKFFLIIFSFLLVVNVNAAENEQPQKATDSDTVALDAINGFSIGGGGLFVNDFAGGFCDIGFNLVHSKDKKMNLRAHTQIGGGADFSGNMQFFARERLMLGTATPITDVFTFRHYYSLDFGVAFFSSKTQEKQFFALPLLLEARLGAGLDFIVKRSSAFFIESGITFRFLSKGDIHDYLGMKRIGGYISIGRRRLY